MGWRHVDGVGDALAAGLLDVGREGDEQAVGGSTTRDELAVADPVVDGAVGDVEALGDLLDLSLIHI